ncbi:hypothetical protein WJX84_005375 [Apatococcus fuscideae]|uniref:Uncharacterized protein n=1 Tax=Apatococcus fuscideae TaxID=2026836 RepID=A0AAW1SUH3_9CHLO
MIGCETFYPSIWNQWEVVAAAAGATQLSGARLPPYVTGPQLIRTLMDEAAQANLTVMRAWAVGVTSNYAIQTSPGVFNEAMFRGIDYALDQARQHNIKVGTSP